MSDGTFAICVNLCNLREVTGIWNQEWGIWGPLIMFNVNHEYSFGTESQVRRT